MSKTKVLCFGFGQVAESFVNKLIDEKKDFDLSVTSRQETHQIELNNIIINSYQFTEDKFDNSIKKKIEEAPLIWKEHTTPEGFDFGSLFCLMRTILQTSWSPLCINDCVCFERIL